MKICVSAITDLGKERTNNEDAVAVCAQLGTKLWNSLSTTQYIPLGEFGAVSIVTDGMGGANAGEVASSIATHSVIDSFDKANLSDIVSNNKAICDFLKSIVSCANNAIMEYVLQDPGAVGLGTTIVITWILGTKAYIVWCGDSRCYCFNPSSRKLLAMTKDHSYVQELVDKGRLSPEKVSNHPDNNIVTRCLGDVDASTEPEIVIHQMNPGEILLSCSDGLCGYCSDSKIEKVLRNYYEKLDICRDKLLNLALDAGGYDNITISLMATLPDNLDIPKVSFLSKIRRLFV